MLIIGVNSAESINEPMVITGATGERFIVWEFNDPTNYLMNNTIIENGIVELEKISSFWNRSTALDYNSGRTQNLTINDEGELELFYEQEGIIIDINTDHEDTNKVDEENSGFQTFKFHSSQILSKIKFLAKLRDTVTKNLNISIETENDEIMEFKSLHPSIFSYEVSEITVNFSCKINANTTYRLRFESEEDDGTYILISDSSSVYSDGYFQEMEDGDYDDDDEDIDLEIYAWKYSSSGMLESNVNKLISPVIWTNLQCFGKNLTNSEDIKIQVRSGDSSNPEDPSWSNWINIDFGDQSKNNLLSLPPTTCIQYRIFLMAKEPYSNTTVDSINISYQRYFAQGFIETIDFAVNETYLWLKFSAMVDYQDQFIEYFYSVDSGSQWLQINSEYEPINLNNKTKTIRFLAKLDTINTAVSPRLYNISVSYTKFNPEEGIDEKDPDIEQPDLQSGGKPQVLPTGTIMIMGIFAGVLLIMGWGAGTETGKFSILNRFLFFIIPLYNKIDRDKVLDNYLRNQIYKYIQTNPGTNYSEIMKDTGVKNGVLVHHLKMLDREGYIKSDRDGMFRRFYPVGVAIPQKEIDHLSWFQIRIFNFIRMNPGTTPKNIADEVGKSKQVVNYHLNLMRNAALVRDEVQGKYTQLYVIYKKPETKNIEP
jgi:DNA-binding MarR family transcriptional regulator